MTSLRLAMKSLLPIRAGAALLTLLGCHAGPPAPPSTAAAPTGTVLPVAATTPHAEAPPDAIAHPAPAAAEATREQALVVHDGHETWTDAEAAARSGYTLVDLSDDWTPYIFAEPKAPDGTVLRDRYRRVFVGLANDTLDEDGKPLPPGAQNYLELYGIPPSFTILRGRFLADEQQSCHASIDQDKLEEVATITYVAPEKMQAEDRRKARLKAELEEARHHAHAATLAELATKSQAGPQGESLPARHRREGGHGRGGEAPLWSARACSRRASPRSRSLRRCHALGGAPVSTEEHDLQGRAAANFGPQMMAWSLLFKEQSGANSALESLTKHGIATDDFGQYVAVHPDKVHGYMIQSMDQMMKSRIQHSLNDAKAQAHYNARINTGPEIRALQ